MTQTSDWPDRWNHVRKILERPSPFSHPDFEPGKENLNFLQTNCKVLVVGAGGLGCELLKDLALMGIKNISIIDMDTIDISNLNRQFLFRQKDVGRSKAEVAADVINSRIPGCNVTPYCNKIQDFDAEFYRQFHIVVCGLDSVIARRWMNGMITSLACDIDEMSEDGNPSIIPFVDGGTEGFKGNARVILPTMNACVECTLDLYPPQVNFPLCTIAHTPRLPEHCIEYVRLLLWPKENPFGEGVEIDGDDPQHIQWIHDKAQERAEEYKIQGVTYRLTQGVIKHIIPAVASTNAVIAAVCAMEVFKIATSCALPLNNYVVFNDTDGLYTYTFEAEKKDDCLSCSQKCQTLTFADDAKLQDVITYLQENGQYQMKSPGITTVFSDGKNKTLYIQTVQSIEEKTRPNLKKTLTELGISNGQEIVVADITTPASLMFKMNLTSKMESV